MRMRTIAIEEHFSTPQYQAAMARATGQTMCPCRRIWPGVWQKLLDLGDGRIADMDAAGIDLQALSLSAGGLDRLDHATGSIAGP